MALHPRLARSPYEPLDPTHRWFPAAEALQESAQEQLLPPLVARIRTAVQAWRDGGSDASAGSEALRGLAHRFLSVDQPGFEHHPPASFAELVTVCRDSRPR